MNEYLSDYELLLLAEDKLAAARRETKRDHLAQSVLNRTHQQVKPGFNRSLWALGLLLGGLALLMLRLTLLA